MPYRYLEDIAIADVAFNAWGSTQQEMFIAAADATINVMVADLSTIAPTQHRTVELEDDNLDMLLFQFLQKFLFFKDAQQLLLRPQNITIQHQNNRFTLTAQCTGEKINPQKHDLLTDVKAVTLHHFQIEQLKDQWHATVILDV